MSRRGASAERDRAAARGASDARPTRSGISRADALDALAELVRRGRLSRRAFVRECVALGISASAAAAWLAGCRRERREDSAGDAGLERDLHIYNWSDYMAPEVVRGFEREFGVHVTYDTYESNEELLAKLQAGARGYDLVVPSNYAVEILLATRRLAPLNPAWLPNLANLDPRFRDPPYDPGNRHSVPYLWGTSGIAVRTDRVPEPVDSWAVLWDRVHAGKMTMLDDAREVLGAALKLLGYSLNSTNPRELVEAKELCLEQKPLLKAYVSAPVKPLLIAGDVWLAQLWSGDTFQAAREAPAIRYAIPREGSALWADNLCVLATAPHPRAAHAFIDYVLRPEVAAAIANAVGYGSPNAKALPLLREELRDDPALYPPPEVLDRLEWIVDVGPATPLYDRIWTEIKAA